MARRSYRSDTIQIEERFMMGLVKFRQVTADTNDDDEMQKANLKLKKVREQLYTRQVRNEDLKLAVAENKLMPVELHRSALNEIVTATVTFLETLPDVLERQLALPGPVVDSLRKSVDTARDSLYEKLITASTAQAVIVAEQPKKRGRPSAADKAAREKVLQ